MGAGGSRYTHSALRRHRPPSHILPQGRDGIFHCGCSCPPTHPACPSRNEDFLSRHGRNPRPRFCLPRGFATRSVTIVARQLENDTCWKSCGVDKFVGSGLSGVD